MLWQTLMVQGTSSDAGKSLLVTALCRWLHQSGISVAPFKPQNMALNSAVTAAGGEIGRAQAVQAMACGLAPHTDMNPVLLKPNTDTGAQVIINGQVIRNMEARAYHDYKTIAMEAVLAAHQRLCQQYDYVIVEGAGSPAEINLRDRDIANMGFAEAIDCPVILIADIDRGGVFAQLIGTLELLSASEQARIKGFVINRFRGDISLLQPGLDWLEQRTQKPVIGVLPYLHGLYLEAEDALPRGVSKQAELNIVVPALPHISNHTDSDPLRLHPQVSLHYCYRADKQAQQADLIILPGSKNVRGDLAWLRAQGWKDLIFRHLRYGSKLIGICGGLQMLGHTIHDPYGLEGEPGSSPGLGLLELGTTLAPEKQLRNVSGKLSFADADCQGYEIHTGSSSGAALQRPAVYLTTGGDGAISADNQILASYVHGLFTAPAACQALLNWAGLSNPERLDYDAIRIKELDRLGKMVAEHLDTAAILALLKSAN